MRTQTATTLNRVAGRVRTTRWLLLLHFCAASLAVGGCAVLAPVTIPADWPEYLPVYPDAKIVDAEFDAMMGASIRQITTDDRDVAKSRYAALLRESGWKIRNRLTDKSDNLVMFANHRAKNRTLTVMLTPDGGGTVLTLLEVQSVSRVPAPKKSKKRR